jgi:hypothetical protein
MVVNDVLIGLTQKEMKERVAWVWGEGHGTYLDYYAHAINNSRLNGGPSKFVKWGDDWFWNDPTKNLSRPKFAGKSPEERMKLFNMIHGKGRNMIRYPEILETGNYKGVLAAFENGTLASFRDPGGEGSGADAFRAVIFAVLGFTKDPTNKAMNWQKILRKGSILTIPRLRDKTYFYKTF